LIVLPAASAGWCCWQQHRDRARWRGSNGGLLPLLLPLLDQQQRHVSMRSQAAFEQRRKCIA
jgi:hypothetical protein